MSALLRGLQDTQTDVLLFGLRLQVYTFALQPLFQGDSAMSASPIARQQQQGPDSSVAGFELQLVMEYCEEVCQRFEFEIFRVWAAC